MDALRTSVGFCVRKASFVGVWLGIFSGLVNLLENAEVEISANGAIVRIDCRNPEIW